MRKTGRFGAFGGLTAAAVMEVIMATQNPAQAGAAPVGPGMGLDDVREKRLERATGSILEALGAERPDYGKLVGEIARAREEADALLALAEKTEASKVEAPKLPARAPVVVPEGATEGEVRARWKEELVLRVRAVHEMLGGKGESSLPKWSEVIGVGWRHRKDRSKRARPTAAALREAHVFGLLLCSDAEVVRVKKGEALFADDLTRGTDGWLMYGPAETTVSEKGLRRRNKRRRNADTMIWTRREFEGNFLFEFTFTPQNGGRGPGALFAICGRPVKEGTDLSVSCGETMDTYNYGVGAYHFSMHRGQTGVCNGRKVGTGLYLIGSRTPDPARETGRAYRVAIGRWGRVVFLMVDGKLLHSYYDAGTFGPPLEGGSVGMRHWGGLDATYMGVEVHRLVEATDG